MISELVVVVTSVYILKMKSSFFRQLGNKNNVYFREDKTEIINERRKRSSFSFIFRAYTYQKFRFRRSK